MAFNEHIQQFTWGFGERGVGRHRFSIIIITFEDGRCPIRSGMTGYPIPRSGPRAGGSGRTRTRIICTQFA